MNLCIIAPRFYPVIGGVESYLRNIVTYCSKYLKLTVVTSNLASNVKFFEKRQYINKTNDLIGQNVEIIRANTLKNNLIKTLFYYNEFLSKKLETILDKKINPHLYSNKKNRINQNLSKSLKEYFIYQRIFTNPNFLQIYYILKRMQFHQKIQVIHSSPLYLTANIYAYRFAKKNKIPFICTPFYHINPYSEFILFPSFQQILRNADRVIACTEIEKEYYIKYGVNKKKIHIIPPGIDPDEYKSPNIKDFKQRYKIPEEAPLLFFMGRRTYEKGFPQAIYALKYLLRKFEDIKLMIAGPMSREYKLFYKNLPSELKRGIIDLGFVDERTKIEAFASCKVFILPSLDDAFGIVYLEAWLFKKPVIGAFEGNVAGLIDNNINGFLIPFNDTKQLASRIEFLLKNDDIRREFGQNGFKKLVENYVLEKTNKKILDLYHEFN